jgi:hypothetical protein
MSEPPPLNWIVINLDTRTDRWAHMQSAFPNYSMERMSAIVSDDPEDACRLSHFTAVRLAKERGLPWIAVLEDDCMPYPEFEIEYPKVLQNLWAIYGQWDMYNGGANPCFISRYNAKFINIREWISTQFLIIPAYMYDTILAHNPEKDLKKIDAYYSKICQTLTSSPMLTYQFDMYSDLAKTHTNNYPLFESSRRSLKMFG